MIYINFHVKNYTSVVNNIITKSGIKQNYQIGLKIKKKFQMQTIFSAEF